MYVNLVHYLFTGVSNIFHWEILKSLFLVYRMLVKLVQHAKIQVHPIPPMEIWHILRNSMILQNCEKWTQSDVRATKVHFRCFKVESALKVKQKSMKVLTFYS